MSESEQTRKCPNCKYSLIGLPTEHSCPECGFDYDPSAIVIRLKPQRHDWRQVVYGILLLGIMYLGVIQRGYSTDVRALVAIVGVSIVVSLFRLFRIHSESQSIKINRLGIEVDDAALAVGIIRWKSVKSVKYSPLRGALIIRGVSRDRLCVWPSRRLGGRRIARRCAEEISRLLSVYTRS